jgi:hypothetical protein
MWKPWSWLFQHRLGQDPLQRNVGRHRFSAAIKRPYGSDY